MKASQPLLQSAMVGINVLPMPGKPNPKAPDFHLNNATAMILGAIGLGPYQQRTL